MLRLAVFALLVAVASARYSALGVVEGIVPCGSMAKVLEVRVTDCVSLPCTIIKGQTYQIEVDFEPYLSHTELEVFIAVVFEEEKITVVDEAVQAVVAPGNAYTLAYPWTVRGDFSGLIRVIIQLSENNIVEVCGIATARVQDPSAIIR